MEKAGSSQQSKLVSLLSTKEGTIMCKDYYYARLVCNKYNVKSYVKTFQFYETDSHEPGKLVPDSTGKIFQLSIVLGFKRKKEIPFDQLEKSSELIHLSLYHSFKLRTFVAWCRQLLPVTIEGKKKEVVYHLWARSGLISNQIFNQNIELSNKLTADGRKKETIPVVDRTGR